MRGNLRHAHLTLHELVKIFILSCKLFLLKNLQLQGKIVSVLLEIRCKEITVLVLGLDESIQSLDEVHKIILIATVESSPRRGKYVQDEPFSTL